MVAVAFPFYYIFTLLLKPLCSVAEGNKGRVMQDINHNVGCKKTVDVGRINREKLFLFPLFISKFIKMNHPLISFVKVNV